MRSSPACLAVLLAILGGCTSAPTIGNAPAVRVSADASADYSRYHTYVFLPGTLSAPPGLVRITGEELDRRVAAALVPRLAGKGLRPAGEAEKPDVYVTYVANVRRDAEIVHANRSLGGYDEPGAVAPGAEWGVREFEQGSLLLQFTDAVSRATVWQAVVAAEVVEGDRSLERSLDVALKKYPPGR